MKCAHCIAVVVNSWPKMIGSECASQCAVSAKRLAGDHAQAKAKVAKNGLTLRHATAELRDDREIVMEAVSQNGPRTRICK